MSSIKVEDDRMEGVIENGGTSDSYKALVKTEDSGMGDVGLQHAKKKKVRSERMKKEAVKTEYVD